LHLAGKVGDLAFEALAKSTRAYSYTYSEELDAELLVNKMNNDAFIMEIKYSIYANFALYYATIR